MSTSVRAERKIAPNKSQLRRIAPLLPNRPAIEPLMGWTAGDDPLARVGIKFGSLTSAVRFAERQRIPYRVEGSTEFRA
jgi:hypothetical protein